MCVCVYICEISPKANVTVTKAMAKMKCEH